ncbi:Cysteine/serine-rich nuclear protein 3-like [Balamuthia mandrillaris]
MSTPGRLPVYAQPPQRVKLSKPKRTTTTTTIPSAAKENKRCASVHNTSNKRVQTNFSTKASRLRAEASAKKLRSLNTSSTTVASSAERSSEVIDHGFVGDVDANLSRFEQDRLQKEEMEHHKRSSIFYGALRVRQHPKKKTNVTANASSHQSCSTSKTPSAIRYNHPSSSSSSSTISSTKSYRRIPQHHHEEESHAVAAPRKTLFTPRSEAAASRSSFRATRMGQVPDALMATTPRRQQHLHQRRATLFPPTSTATSTSSPIASSFSPLASSFVEQQNYSAVSSPSSVVTPTSMMRRNTLHPSFQSPFSSTSEGGWTSLEALSPSAALFSAFASVSPYTPRSSSYSRRASILMPRSSLTPSRSSSTSSSSASSASFSSSALTMNRHESRMMEPIIEEEQVDHEEDEAEEERWLEGESVVAMDHPPHIEGEGEEVSLHEDEDDEDEEDDEEEDEGLSLQEKLARMEAEEMRLEEEIRAMEAAGNLQ